MSTSSLRLTLPLVLAGLVLIATTFEVTYAQSSEEEQIRRLLLPAPSGPHAVGVTRFALEDSTRTDTVAAESAIRRLVVWIWYPCIVDSTGALNRPYMDAPTAKALSSNQGIPEAILEGVVGHAVADPPPSSASGAGWPVLLFSHGLSWPVSYYQTILSDLVSRGHLVIAIEHTHGADPVVFPSGEVVPFGLFGNFEEEVSKDALWEYLRTWQEDQLFVLSTVRKGRLPSALARSVVRTADFRRVGTFGHSYGGAAAILAAEASPAILGAVNLEGSSFYADPPYRVATPTLFVMGGVNESNLAGREYGSGGETLVEAVVRGATHSTFSDLMILFRSYSNTMGPPGRIHPTRGTTVTSALVARFFQGLFEGVPITDFVGTLRMYDVEVVVSTKD
jgi:dienelactone hydrolase